jgi:hypothetical protein
LIGSIDSLVAIVEEAAEEEGDFLVFLIFSQEDLIK